MNDDREIIRLYSQLIQAVESKYSNESRHETALRYIQQCEKSGLTPQGGK